MLDSTRLRNPQLFDKIVTPEEAAALITDGMNVGVSGFTPSGYPKKTTIALAKAIKEGKRDKRQDAVLCRVQQKHEKGHQ